MNNLNNTVPQIFEWTDPVKTGAQGWVVIDSLVNAVSGGGLFIHSEATIEEVSDLAKTMSFKNTLLEPILGGAKAGIRFDHKDPRAPDVIRRFLFDHKALLENFWVTAADLNTRNDFIFDVIERDLKLSSAFFSLGKMLNKQLGVPDQSASLRKRLSSSVGKNFNLESCSTGYSVATAIKLLTAESKPRVLIQGFGTVGTSLSYFLHLHRIATVVGIADIDGFIYHPEGISIENLIGKKNYRSGLVLSAAEKIKYNWTHRLKFETDEEFLCRFLFCQTAEIFSPCATRYQLTKEVANILLHKTFHDIESSQRFIVSGANNAFRSESVRILLENGGVRVLPEWVSNCGNTILFMESMKEVPLNKDWNEHVFGVIRMQLEAFIQEGIVEGNKDQNTLYEKCSALATHRLKDASMKDNCFSRERVMA